MASKFIPVRTSAMEDNNKIRGLEALNSLKSAELPLYLTSSLDLSMAARCASEFLFAMISPFAPKSSLCRLYTDGFDEEQIWQQIDLQARPLLPKLRQHVRYFEKKADEISKQFNVEEASGRGEFHIEDANEDLDDDEDDEDENEGEIEEEEEDEEDEEEEEKEEEEEEEEEDDDEETEGVNHNDGNMDNHAKQSLNNVVEDDFLKISELEDYLLEDEDREFGQNKKSKRKRRATDEDEESADDDDEYALGLMMGLDADGDEGAEMENARYTDFFDDGKTKKKKSPRSSVGSDMYTDNQSEDRTDDQFQNKGKALSTHEKEQQILQSEIEKLERANLEPKTWTMQGEITAANRPKNSALEVDLDFEHNVRPVPVITEEVTVSLEELIRDRIAEGRFDDIKTRPSLPTKAPKEKIELDESKSKKGIAELYEDEYVQKTGFVSNALSFSDEQKKEASMLYKKLCGKLDALSHFYFTPRPVIEDMSIQANVPALAMEEVVPLAVSDAAMLAPEEIFSSKGEVKEEAELTKADRKRRRATKKRKMKAVTAKKTFINTQLSASKTKNNGNENLTTYKR